MSSYEDRKRLRRHYDQVMARKKEAQDKKEYDERRQAKDYRDSQTHDSNFEAGKRRKRAANLEQRIETIVVISFLGVALMLGSLTLTGNAVSNLTETTTGLLGLILYAAGIAGIYFFLRRNKR